MCSKLVLRGLLRETRERRVVMPRAEESESKEGMKSSGGGLRVERELKDGVVLMLRVGGLCEAGASVKPRSGKGLGSGRASEANAELVGVGYGIGLALGETHAVLVGINRGGGVGDNGESGEGDEGEGEGWGSWSSFTSLRRLLGLLSKSSIVGGGE